MELQAEGDKVTRIWRQMTREMEAAQNRELTDLQTVTNKYSAEY